MSRNDWESGTLTLPAAAVAVVKKAVRDEHNACVDAIRAACKTFWTDHAKRTKSADRYSKALDTWQDSYYNQPRRQSMYYTPTPADQRADFVFSEAHDVLSGMLWNKRFRQATMDDLKAAGWEKATNRTNTFRVGEAVIRFDGRKVTYHSGENNRQVEHARGLPVVRAFFAALEKVNWTRATGGAIIGNDEYNIDAGREYAGGGGSYITASYGPLGENEQAYQMGVTPAKYRKMMKDARAARNRPVRYW